jgi:hypothetical protein
VNFGFHQVQGNCGSDAVKKESSWSRSSWMARRDTKWSTHLIMCGSCAPFLPTCSATHRLKRCEPCKMYSLPCNARGWEEYRRGGSPYVVRGGPPFRCRFASLFMHTKRTWRHLESVRLTAHSHPCVCCLLFLLVSFLRPS